MNGAIFQRRNIFNILRDFTGRGKKKILKHILPLLVAAKVKMGALAVLAYFAIALIAKKAIFASLIAIAISGFLKLKSYFQSQGGAGITGYNNGWSSASSNAWAGPSVSSGAWQSGSSGWDAGASQGFSGYH